MVVPDKDKVIGVNKGEMLKVDDLELWCRGESDAPTPRRPNLKIHTNQARRIATKNRVMTNLKRIILITQAEADPLVVPIPKHPTAAAILERTTR